MTNEEKLYKLISEATDFSIHEEWGSDYTRLVGQFTAEIEWFPEGAEIRSFLESKVGTREEAIEDLYEKRYGGLQ